MAQVLVFYWAMFVLRMYRRIELSRQIVWAVVLGSLVLSGFALVDSLCREMQSGHRSAIVWFTGFPAQANLRWHMSLRNPCTSAVVAPLLKINHRKIEGLKNGILPIFESGLGEKGGELPFHSREHSVHRKDKVAQTQTESLVALRVLTIQEQASVIGS